MVPTKGRSLDHIGFEVKDIDAFASKLQAAGSKLDAAVRNRLPECGPRRQFDVRHEGSRR
jgi:hypothetical protein